MPNIIRRATEEHPMPAVRDRDPFTWMRDLMRWDPFREMAPAWPVAGRELTFAPAFEVKENAEAFLFKADLPGVKDKDVEVKLTGNRLSVSGKRDEEKQDKSDTYYTYERSYGSFLRTFTLPEGIDAEHISAELKEGVLTIAVPKKAAAQPKTVAVKSGDAPKS